MNTDEINQNIFKGVVWGSFKYYIAQDFWILTYFNPWYAYVHSKVLRYVIFELYLFLLDKYDGTWRFMRWAASGLRTMPYDWNVTAKHS